MCDFESASSRIPRVREMSFVFPRRVPLLVVDGKLCASLRERVSIPSTSKWRIYWDLVEKVGANVLEDGSAKDTKSFPHRIILV